MGPDARPVEALLLRVVEQALAEQGIDTEDQLLVQGHRLAHDGQRHVLAHADVRHRDGARAEHHPHRQAVDEQGAALVDAECKLQAQIDGARARIHLRPRA
ncbi:hypothetical protein [Thauera humireducens]|uniref:hypothetical protein n=1 Tax=Thauera humireducens TaxID=1134435 RepID=UPI00311DE956